MKGSYEEGGRKQRERQTSEEEEEGGGERSTKRPKNTSSTDGASIEVVRRPRGRPPGSKNKPKPPPIIITRETTDSSMRPHVLHLPAGIDVVDAISRFARRLNVGLCVLTGTGTVTNVTLRHPTTTVTFHGRYDILSISATFLPPSFPPLSFQANGFKVLIAGAQGEIVGGSVVGSLVAASTVVVVATVFSSPSFHRLSGEEEISLSGSDTSTHHHQFEPQQQQQQQDDHESHMSVYSCNLPSSVIWAPIARPPPPY
ncbi:AT-hook motif nuclear-localized protein 17-like protein [Cinnamomum micranthum f. kanehirae]|uniref:AT-hook motif nuclear-localized protein n=1 Tax=Cinnamomum micranthum f. kanehirae TaxID=337451 RepID=A0A443P051_9MAGN|nr:AT-hook motif nuclear-localized protein 17-like protein [Cinnamomum micranthum f. kanehirae]